ncbi:thiol reductant ABC exporter subunit CydD [Microbacterium sp. NPDC091313]
MKPVDPRLLRYARASRGFLAVTAAVVFAQTGVTVGFAWCVAHALVGAIDGRPLGDLGPLIAATAGLIVLRSALAVAAERVAARGGAAAAMQLRAALVDAVRRLGPRWLSRRSSASLAVTAGHGLEALEGYFSRYLPQLVATAITTPVLLAAIAASDPLSGVVVLVTLPLIPIFMVLIGLATRTAQRRQFATLGHLASRFSDTVEGLGTLKVYGRHHRAAASIGAVTRRYARETMAVLRVSFLSGFALEFLAAISVAIVAVSIGFRLLDGEMSLVVGLFVLLLAPDAYLPLRQVGVQFHAAAEGVAATETVFAALDDARATPDAADRRGGATPGGAVRARALRVPRGDRSPAAVDLDLVPGRVTWLRGPSGAGKSSVVAALLGFADFTGELTSGGAAVADVRDRVAWSGQRAALMPGTVAENVALGVEILQPDLVQRCLREAAAAEIAPDTVLGAGGSGLSGGQAQRVAIARALYRLRTGRADVLILDEPSSAVDGDTEATLWRSIRAIADEGVAVLVVSHRETAATIADDVVSLSAALAGGRS